MLCVLLELPTTWSSAVQVVTDPGVVEKLCAIAVGKVVEGGLALPVYLAALVRQEDAVHFAAEERYKEDAAQLAALAAELNITARTVARKNLVTAMRLCNKRPDVRAEARALRVKIGYTSVGCAALEAIVEWATAFVLYQTGSA
jgi:hypothetical protein